MGRSPRLTGPRTIPDRGSSGRSQPWTPRFTDFDVLGHVNNTVYWAIVEEFLDLTAPTTVELEYRGGIDRGQHVEVISASDALWITADGAVAASALLRADPV